MSRDPAASGEPYEILADRYDAVMSHVDYPGWARLVERFWGKFRKTPRRILETGAGTCRLTPQIARPGRSIVSTDLSFPMLARGFARSPRRTCCDYRALPFRDGSFDAILCLYDAVNYCLAPSDLESFFSEARRVLAPGGILVFDATTVRNSRLHFADELFHEVHGGADVIRHSWYDSPARAQHNDFTFFLPRPDGTYERREESHVQRVWPRPAFQKMCQKAGLDLVGTFGEDLQPADADAFRLHMVALAP